MTHATSAGTWDGARVRLTDPAAYRRSLDRLGLQVGDAVVIRIERPEDAYTHAQLKGYFGYVVKPFSDTTGYHPHEVHAMLKATCLPEGKTSLTELNREELSSYITAATHTAQDWCPEAFSEGR